MPDYVSMAGWIKGLLIVVGLLGTNTMTNAAQNLLLVKPAEREVAVQTQSAEERNAYAASTEDRLYECQDRLASCQDALYECRER